MGGGEKCVNKEHIIDESDGLMTKELTDFPLSWIFQFHVVIKVVVVRVAKMVHATALVIRVRLV